MLLLVFMEMQQVLVQVERKHFTVQMPNRAGDSKQLATFIQNRLYKAMDTKNRGVKDKNFMLSMRNSITSSISGIRFHDKSRRSEKTKIQLVSRRSS